MNTNEDNNPADVYTVDDAIADLGMTGIAKARTLLGVGQGVGQSPANNEDDPKARLEYLRGELRAERIGQGELAELESLAKHIEPGDVELLEAAGVPEHSVAIEISISYRVYDYKTIEIPSDRFNDIDLDDEEVLEELLAEFGGFTYGEDDEVELSAEVIEE